MLSFQHELKGTNNPAAVGVTNEIGNTEENVLEVLVDGVDTPNQAEEETSRTGAHEYGHSLGLLHGGEKGSLLENANEPNLMNQTNNTSSTTINTTQLEKAKQTVTTNTQNQIQKEKERQMAIDQLNQAGGL